MKNGIFLKIEQISKVYLKLLTYFPTFGAFLNLYVTYNRIGNLLQCPHEETEMLQESHM